MILRINDKDWMTPKEAVERLRVRFKLNTINDDYVRRLANLGKVEKLSLNGRTNVYSAADIEKIEILKGPGAHPKPRTKARRRKPLARRRTG